MSIAMTTLVENNPGAHLQLIHEHGLAVHVKTPQTAFLFDCGASGGFVANADKLGIDLGELDFVACSHSHFDHAGGFRTLVARHGVRRFITGEGYFEPKYARDGMCHSHIGVDFNPDYLSEHSIPHDICGDVMRIDDCCWLVGNFERTALVESIPGHFAIWRDGSFKPDLFADEICVALRFKDGLAVLAGCSHPGVINLLRTVEKRLSLPIRGVWGGAHLHNAEPERLSATVEAMKDMGIRYFGLSHCSGEGVLAFIKQTTDIVACHMRTGDGVLL